ncbi:MAG TPA: flavin reductase family protein [Paracoccaceae bacterium]|nr:flavin reductase family protein [Paracoccaceae bacterium]
MTSLDPRALRNAFGSFMTGVTVVTALRDDGTPVGFTANSFSSVSLDPPLLLVCPGKFLSSYEAFANCTHFAVNILAEGQEDVSNTFASFKGDRFAKVSHSLDLHGVPLIDGASTHFSCTTHHVSPAGDHCILIGQVAAFEHSDRQGLGYVGGQYFSLGLERSAFEETSSTAVCGAIVEDGDNVLLVRTEDGFRPPQSTHADRGRLITELQDTLAGKGITAELGQAYSVFEGDKTRAHQAYFLATGSVTQPSADIVSVPINDLPQLAYTTPAIGRMMNRFALEARTRNFSLYLGNTENGAVHDLPRRN